MYFCATFFLIGLQHGSGTDQLKSLGLDTELKYSLHAAGEISDLSLQGMQSIQPGFVSLLTIYWMWLQTENTTITRKQMLDPTVSHGAPSFHWRMSSVCQGSRCWHLSTPNQITIKHRGGGGLKCATNLSKSRWGRQMSHSVCVWLSCVLGPVFSPQASPHLPEVFRAISLWQKYLYSHCGRHNTADSILFVYVCIVSLDLFCTV